MNPTIYIVRHGDTDLNDDKDEKFRAWSDIPLNARGIDAAHQAACHLAKLRTKEELHYAKVIASDLARTVQTSHIIAEELMQDLYLDRGLRPWDLGIFTGKSVKAHVAQLNEYQDNPDKSIPQGESYMDFYNRYSAALHKYMQWATRHPEQVLILVTHSRNLLALPTIVQNRPVGDVPVKGGPAPAEIICVEKQGDSWKISKET